MKNTKEEITDFEGRMNVEVRRQEKLDWAEEKDFRRVELPGKYMTKLLYGWDDEKFEEKRRLNQQVPLEVGTLKEGIMLEMQSLDTSFFI